MAQVRGNAVKVQIVPESPFKTPGAVGEQLSYVSCGVVPDQQREPSATMNGTHRGQPRSTEGNKAVAGPLLYEIAPEDVGIYLKNLVGAPTTSGAGPYTHVFQPAMFGANALPIGFAIQYDYGAGIAAASRYLRQIGCRISQATFNFRQSGAQTISFDVIGSDFAKSNTDLDATPVILAHTNFEAANLAIVIGGGAPKDICLLSATLTYSNDLDQEKFCISGGGVRDGLDEGMAIVSGQLEAFFDDEDVIDTVLSGVDTEILFTLSRGDGLGSAGNESLTIHVGDIVFAKTAPPINGPRGLRCTMNFTAHRVAAAELDAVFTLKNAVATVT
jgi:hypothetical protein